jgi:hypothetical protein
MSGVALAGFAGGGVAQAETETARPSSFTSAFSVMATPDEIYNADKQKVPGEAGATGIFNFMINSKEEIICYDITLTGVTPPYMSMAKTATHIHEGAAGVQGPPRISFPNPAGAGSELTSEGCLKGPFTTGIQKDGKDTGEGFTLAKLEANPSAYYADTHTEKYMAGAVRGQLGDKMPVGGVETGMGGGAQHLSTGAMALAGAGSIVMLGAAGLRVAKVRSRR